MAGNNYQITGDNLPKDSGNRYFNAPYDPSANAFVPAWAYPVSGSAAGTVIGHGYQQISDVMTSTGARSSGVDLGGYTVRGLQVPIMGSACWIQFLPSASGAVAAGFLATNGNIVYSATAGGFSYFLDQTILQHLAPYRWVQISATQPQTAQRTFIWVLNT